MESNILLKWVCLAGFATVFGISIILDLHFRLILVIGILAIAYKLRQGGSQNIESIQKGLLLQKKEILSQYSQQNLLTTIEQLNDIHQSTADAERQNKLAILQKQIELSNLKQTRREELQNYRHARELGLLTEAENKADQELQGRTTKYLKEVRRKADLELEKAKTNSVQKQAALDKMVTEQRTLEQSRVNECIRRTNEKLQNL